jgi:hypothetical protein
MIVRRTFQTRPLADFGVKAFSFVLSLPSLRREAALSLIFLRNGVSRDL